MCHAAGKGPWERFFAHYTSNTSPCTTSILPSDLRSPGQSIRFPSGPMPLGWRARKARVRLFHRISEVDRRDCRYSVRRDVLAVFFRWRALVCGRPSGLGGIQQKSGGRRPSACVLFAEADGSAVIHYRKGKVGGQRADRARFVGTRTQLYESRVERLQLSFCHTPPPLVSVALPGGRVSAGRRETPRHPICGFASLRPTGMCAAEGGPRNGRQRGHGRERHAPAKRWGVFVRTLAFVSAEHKLRPDFAGAPKTCTSRHGGANALSDPVPPGGCAPGRPTHGRTPPPPPAPRFAVVIRVYTYGIDGNRSGIEWCQAIVGYPGLARLRPPVPESLPRAVLVAERSWRMIPKVPHADVGGGGGFGGGTSQYNASAPTTGLRECGNDTGRNTGRSGRQNTAPRRSLRRDERVSAQGPEKKQRPDGMSRR